MRVLAIGALTIDYIDFYGKYREEMLGGGAFYSAIAARKLGAKVTLLTTVGRDFNQKYLDLIESTGTEVYLLKDEGTVKFLNYLIRPGLRKQEVLSTTTKKIMEIPFDLKEFEIIHITPVLGEIDDVLVEYILKNNFKGKISIEVQGFVREDKVGPLRNIFWDSSEKWLKSAFSLHLSKEELLFAVKRRIQELIKSENNEGANYVALTMASYGSFVFSKNERHFIPIPRELIFENDVGCGDIYSMVFSLKIVQGKELIDAGLEATATAVLRAKCRQINEFLDDDLSIDTIKRRLKEHQTYYGLSHINKNVQK
ncbi:MAG: PfkB family carbohydrate kinase [Thermoproteota archaeon]